MEFKRIELVMTELENFVTELKFEIATARTEGARILRIDITEQGDTEKIRKNYSSLTRTLKAMKQRRMIGLFAYPSDFERHSTESVFLLNKYREHIDSSELSDNKSFLYIML